MLMPYDSETEATHPTNAARTRYRAAVLGSMGIAITSEWMFVPELASGAMRTVLAEWTLPTIDL